MSEGWTIYKRTGELDDVIEGPDTGEQHDGGIDVVPALRAQEAERLLEAVVAPYRTLKPTSWTAAVAAAIDYLDSLEPSRAR